MGLDPNTELREAGSEYLVAGVAKPGQLTWT
jgi:hypothetical protein